jgi:hypothetical protein
MTLAARYAIYKGSLDATAVSDIKPRAFACATTMGDYLRTTPAAPSDPPRVWEPLYDQSALDAAVAAERERIAAMCLERSVHFANDEAARSFAGLVVHGRA